MPHPYSDLLKEFEHSLKKVPPTLLGVADEYKKKLAAMRADESIDEETIRNAMVELGRKEFPHRHALLELHNTYESQVEMDMVLEHLDAAVAKKVAPMVKHGVTIEELIKSDWAEEKLSPEERYQVEDGLLLARYKLEAADKGLVGDHKAEFEKLVKKWEKRAVEIDEKINMLRTLAKEDPELRPDILEDWEKFRAGWTLMAHDPDPKEIDAAVENWKGVLGLEEEA